MTQVPVKSAKPSRPKGTKNEPTAQAQGSSPLGQPSSDALDNRYLESLLGYNARRVALHVIAQFLVHMAPHELKPVSFSVLSLIHHNPGITAKQLCTQLFILPPNIVALINSLQRRELIERKPHPTDKRAHGLFCTPAGQQLAKQAEQTATALEIDASKTLSNAERKTLLILLQKVYKV